MIGLNFLLIEDLDPSDLKIDGKNLLPKLHGALIKNEQDIQLFEQLAFMSRREVINVLDFFSKIKRF